MTLQLRPLNPATDFERFAAIHNAHEPNPITVELLQKWESERPEGQLRHRSVVVDQHGQIVGFNDIVYEPWERRGRYWLEMYVDPDRLRQGIGTLLYNDAFQFAQQHGITDIKGAVRDNCPECLRFAQQRGYTIDRHIFDSALELASYDEQPFVHALETARASGIRFFSLADLEVTEDIQRKLYELNSKLILDVPGWDRDLAPFEQFKIWVFEAEHYRPEGQIIAADGDQWIGLAALGYFPKIDSAINMITGVDRSYRGRKIALALKVLAHRLAREWGFGFVRTNNDSLNAPMLTINRKMGYQPEPGKYILQYVPATASTETSV
jgi:GNAT superfamily N-acetyltransferase